MPFNDLPMSVIGCFIMLHLFDHVSDFPLLTFEHVIQAMVFIFQSCQLLFQLFRPAVQKTCMFHVYTLTMTLLVTHVCNCIRNTEGESTFKAQK